MSKKKSSLLVLVAILLGVAGVIARPSSAAAYTYDDCPSGVACVYTGLQGTGSMKTIGVGEHTINYCYNFSTSWDNRANSAYNRFQPYAGHMLYFVMWTNQGCSGSSQIWAAPSTGDVTFGNYNAMSSFKIWLP